MPDPTAPASSAQAPGAAGEPPRPMPFAIMRNAHEALRASITLQQQQLEAADIAAFRQEWQTFQQALGVHMAMEDDAMFALLDAVGDGAVTAASLPQEHLEDRRLAAAVDAALADAEPDAVRSAWVLWQEDHLQHLSHEEDVMMPLTMKTAATPEGRARIVHEQLLLPCQTLPHFEWYIGWVVRMLSSYGSASQSPAVATRVFAWGLQHGCSPQQWQRLRPVVQDNCPPALWAELCSQFGLDAEGKVV